MITTGAVDSDVIEQFKNDIQQYDSVEAVYVNHGRSLSVKVQKTDDGVPSPHRDLGDIVDGNVVTDDYIVSGLAGSGHSPGDKYVHKVAVSPPCSDCGDAPQKGLDEDDDRCSDCAFGDNLLSAEPGTTAIVEAVDVWGCRHDEGDQVEATADDDDGFLRGPEGVFNSGRYDVVEIVDGGDR